MEAFGEANHLREERHNTSQGRHRCLRGLTVLPAAPLAVWGPSPGMRRGTSDTSNLLRGIQLGSGTSCDAYVPPAVPPAPEVPAVWSARCPGPGHGVATSSSSPQPSAAPTLLSAVEMTATLHLCRQPWHSDVSHLGGGPSVSSGPTTYATAIPRAAGGQRSPGTSSAVLLLLVLTVPCSLVPNGVVIKGSVRLVDSGSD